MNILPHYILDVDDSGDLGIQETSYVEYPATQMGMLCFNDDKPQDKAFKQIEFANEGEMMRMTSGVLMMPDTKYLRATADGYFYTVEFKADTLKKAMINYLKQNNQNNVKVEHEGNNLRGFSAIEHWIITSKDTVSPIFGFSLSDLGYNVDDIPVGTIMKTTYISNEKFWNEQILTGKVTGYSIGGMFEMKPVEEEVNNFSKQNIEIPNMKEVQRLLGLSDTQNKIKTRDNVELAFGQVIKAGDTSANGDYLFAFSEKKDLTVKIANGVIVDYGFSDVKVETKAEDTTLQMFNELKTLIANQQEQIKLLSEKFACADKEDDMEDDMTEEEMKAMEDEKALKEAEDKANAELAKKEEEKKAKYEEEKAKKAKEFNNQPIKKVEPKKEVETKTAETFSLNIGLVNRTFRKLPKSNK